ncbi:hypothetical protein V8E36_003988 [Tilletia maclaganii]
MAPSRKRSNAAAATYDDGSAAEPEAPTLVRLAKDEHEQPAGLNEQLKRLRDRVFKPLSGNPLYHGIKLPPGVILHGPPGTGKTMLVKYTAAQSQVFFICLKAADINDKFLGQSEKALRSVFDAAKRSPPAVIMIDEIDCIFPNRAEGTVHQDSIQSQVLTELDNIANRNIVLIATTNRLDAMDPALRLRLPLQIEVPLPDWQTRLAVLKSCLARHHHRLEPRQVEMLASSIAGCNSSAIAEMVEDAVCHVAVSMDDAILPPGATPPTVRRALTYRDFTIPPGGRSFIFNRRGKKRKRDDA